MMRKFNKEKCLIYNTIQMYRNDRLNYLTEIINISKTEKFLSWIKNCQRWKYHERNRKIKKIWIQMPCTSD